MSAPVVRAACVTVGLVLALCQAPAAKAHSLETLENRLESEEPYVEIVDRAAPPFALNDAAGDIVRLADFMGKVVVLWFVYMRCPDVCPLHSEALASIQEQVNGTPMQDQVRFVTKTTDPAHDTADALARYGLLHGLDPVN